MRSLPEPQKELEDQLSVKMDRWIYLNDLAEKINNV